MIETISVKKFASIIFIILAAFTYLTVNAVLKSEEKVIVDGPVNVGTVQSGNSIRFDVNVLNNRSVLLSIASIKSSCPCLSPLIKSFTVEPYKNYCVKFEFDTASEPNFTGALSINIQGLDEQSHIMFESTTQLVVEKN